ncbi:LysR family transcriptional regulator [Rhodococcus koreensis]
MWHTRDLSYFVAVAEHLHFTRAATAIYVSQSALSKQIASLERHLGVQLFHRVRDGVRLTSAGEALLPYARDVLAISDQAEKAVRTAASRVDELTIGFWLAPGGGVIDRTLREFKQSHPESQVLLRRADWSEPVAGLEAHACSVAVVHAEHGYVFRGLSQAVLSTEPMVLAMSTDHPLTAKSEVNQEDLADHIVLTLPADAAPATEVSLRMSRAGLSTRTVRTIDETLASLASGLGVITVPPSIIRAYLPHPVVSRPLLGAPEMDLVAIWRPADEVQLEMRALVACLARAANLADA